MSKSASNPLPSPADRPHADVVLYDGQCVFCRQGMERLQWWDCQAKLAYLSIHDPQVAQLWPDVSHDRLLEEMCLIEGGKQQGRRHWGADAVKVFTRRLRRLWWLMPVMHFPGMMLIARPVYRWVARNRYLIAGKREDCDSGSCSIHR